MTDPRIERTTSFVTNWTTMQVITEFDCVLVNTIWESAGIKTRAYDLPKAS